MKSDRPRRVFIVHHLRDDISPASEYGVFNYINSKYVYSNDVKMSGGGLPKKVLENIEMAAEDFDPENDYVLIAGDHLQIIAFTVALSIRYDRFTVLRWDRAIAGYFPVVIFLNDDGLCPADGCVKLAS